MISIIMPVRNALPYLEECLESIINQSIQNWELIAINDHSTDSSLVLLESYAIRDERIQCYKNEGKGIIDALNTGYAYARGYMVTRMDADDVMPIKKMETLKALLTANGKGHLSTGKVKYISETHLGNGFTKYQNWLNELCDNDNHYDEVYRECVIVSPCWMMYRSDFEAIGGFDSDEYPEDYDLCFRMYENGIKVLPSLEIMHIWRDHGGRASRNDIHYSDNRFLDMKTKYFLRNECQQNGELILWGAGKKGKHIAKILIERNITFKWITENEKKIGKHIYNKEMMSPMTIKEPHRSKSIILAVANEIEQKNIVNYVKENWEFSKIFKFC